MTFLLPALVRVFGRTRKEQPLVEGHLGVIGCFHPLMGKEKEDGEGL